MPILYKLFSRVLCRRVKDELVAEQSEDLARFRPDYNRDDHLFAITLLADKCNEFTIPLWTATLDFRYKHWCYGDMGRMGYTCYYRSKAGTVEHRIPN